MGTPVFMIEESGGLLTGLYHLDDPHRMNWVEGGTPWGTVRAPVGVECVVTRELAGEVLRETYAFTNATPYPALTGLGELGIYAPFNDSYHEAALCMTKRCHAHIWCGGTSSYVMCLRMGGDAPHLGLVLTEGSLGAYCVERDLTQGSNDRGDIILCPSPMRLAPGETRAIRWELFWHQGKAGFYRRLEAYPSYIAVETERFVRFRGEDSPVSIRAGGGRRGRLAVSKAPDRCPPARPGEETFRITGEAGEGEGEGEAEVDAWYRTLTVPPLGELALARCLRVVREQQHIEPGTPLDGAFLVYDNEEGHRYYSHGEADHNAGRERVGMGLLLAHYLRSPFSLEAGDGERRAIAAGLDRYKAFVLRELVDPVGGEVFDDLLRDTSRVRLYNYPWYARFFLELYEAGRESDDLITAYRILKAFYRRGGERFYAIAVPMLESVRLLGEAGLGGERAEMEGLFLRHAAVILANGTDYPAHEVKYEQSIVAPGADILLQAYRISGKGEYLEGARRQLAILDLFSALQPDSCLYGTAIRHWDGFWFGKRRLYGDTFPHYWSALSGMAWASYSRCGGGEEALRSAERSIRGVLGLFFPGGEASCARLYPLEVNGRPGSFLDPWSNDQDWGLYFALRFFTGDF